MLVSGVRMTVLSGRERMCGGQEAGGGRDKILRFHHISEKLSNLKVISAILNSSYLLPVAVGCWLTLTTSIVVDFVVVVVGVTVSTVVVKEESVPAIHNIQ